MTQYEAISRHSESKRVTAHEIFSITLDEITASNKMKKSEHQIENNIGEGISLIIIKHTNRRMTCIFLMMKLILMI